jgi:dTDP-glucose 4,6-dehydratase
MVQKNHILVTGGAGFIGSNFTRLALSRGYRVTVIDKLTYAGRRASLAGLETDPDFYFLHAGIENQHAVNQFLENLGRKYCLSAVVNFAAETHVDRSIDAPDIFFETNVLGTQRLISTLMRSGNLACDFRFLHVSTDEVYGSADDHDFDETTSYNPNSPYAASKAGADHLVRAAFKTYGFPAIITNCSNNYGPFQFPEKLIPLVITKALGELPVPIYGDGGQIRDWLFVQDHCAAILVAMEKASPGETYVLGANNPMTNLSIVEKICSLLDSFCPRLCKASYHDLITFVADRPGHDRRYAVNSEKFRKKFDWTAETSFEQGPFSTIDWYLANQKWWEAILADSYSLERLGLNNRIALVETPKH